MKVQASIVKVKWNLPKVENKARDYTAFRQSFIGKGKTGSGMRAIGYRYTFENIMRLRSAAGQIDVDGNTVSIDSLVNAIMDSYFEAVGK